MPTHRVPTVPLYLRPSSTFKKRRGDTATTRNNTERLQLGRTRTATEAVSNTHGSADGPNTSKVILARELEMSGIKCSLNFGETMKFCLVVRFVED